MVKLIIFDLDGVLVKAKKIHFDALNSALGKRYAISWDEHLAEYDGLKTKEKLFKLTKSKNLPVDLYQEIWDKKQKNTLQLLSGIKPNDNIKWLFGSLSAHYKIAVCSNSIRKTVLTVLAKLDIIEYVDIILSNEDVQNSKPHPEMYWRAISKMGVLPEESIIVEDSPVGLLAANRSRAHIIRVQSPDDVNMSNIYPQIQKINMQNSVINKWKDDNLNILIPMAGAGTRFATAGYTFPKPLIEVNGKPMIQLVVENLNIEANYIYVVQKSHREKYNLDTLLRLITPNCKIVETDGMTEGAACTALLAKNYINNNQPLFFANSDQWVEWDSNEFMYKMQETDADGGILTFDSCFGYRTLIDTLEYGKIPIGKIVTNKLPCNVMSYNEKTNLFEYCKVLDYIKLDGSNKKWKKLKTKWNGVTKVTEDHEFLTNNGWISIRSINNNKILTNKNCMNDIQYQIFVGTMLGDSSIAFARGGVNSGLKFGHSIKQKDWVLNKLKIFKSLGTTYKENIINDKYKTCLGSVKITEEFKKLRYIWYPEGIKIVPKNIELTPLVLATWYMDDGTLVKNKTPVPRFGTDGFDNNSIDILIKKINKLGYKTYIINNKNRKRICIKAESSDKFFKTISKYIIPSMAYKLPEQYRQYSKEWDSIFNYIENKYYCNDFELDDINNITSDIKYAWCLKTQNGNFLVDGLVAHNCHPKWSYAKINDKGLVTEVAEKNPISDMATVGYYYWKHGYDFVKYAEQMINKNERINNEFYVCPVFNQAIADSKQIRVHSANKMWGLGTPEDLQVYLQNHKY